MWPFRGSPYRLLTNHENKGKKWNPPPSDSLPPGEGEPFSLSIDGRGLGWGWYINIEILSTKHQILNNIKTQISKTQDIWFVNFEF